MYCMLLLVVSPQTPAWVPLVGSSIRRFGEYVLMVFLYTTDQEEFVGIVTVTPVLIVIGPADIPL